MTGCAQTAVYRLSDVKEGNAKASSAKYRLDRQTDRQTHRQEDLIQLYNVFKYSVISIFSFLAQFKFTHQHRFISYLCQ